MPKLPPTQDGGPTDAAGDAPTREEPAHRTPDESTLGLAPSSHPTGAQAGAEGAVAPLDIGEILAGRFTVLGFIARGGMGAVYEATDVLLRTRVALKVIGGHLAADATAMERFRREVLLARRVSHPNVCRVYELYEARTAKGVLIHFLTMELLEGESLARRLAQSGRMTTDEASPLVTQMCEGLGAAHAEGVIHRDFKSSNVLLVPRPAVGGEQPADSTRVVITDFGVARAVTLAVGEDAGEGPLTGQGILGTPEYMAPEQVTGAEVTAASDIYALGVVLYEMVTGKLPFAADTPLATAARRLNEAPPRPETIVPGLDKRWVAAIVQCLARQPERRFRRAQDIIPALDRPTKWPRAPLPLAATGLLLLLVGAYGAVKYRPTLQWREPQTKAAFTAPRPMVAIVGVRNALASPKLKWLSTAVTEVLAHEMAAAESSLRAIPSFESLRLDSAYRSLGVSEDDVGDEKVQRRLQALLGANVLLHGSLSPGEPGSDRVLLRIQALEPESRREVGSFEEDLGPNGARLLEALPQVGARVRSVLAASMTAEEQTALAASRAHNLEAARLYAEGVMRRRLWDLEEARSHFEAAVATDPGFLQAQAGIALTWETQGNVKMATGAWRRLRDRPDGLTARQAAVIDAGLLEDKGKRTDALKALVESMPDDPEAGSGLLANLPPRATLALVKRLKQMETLPPLQLELSEAGAAAASGDLQLAAELLGHVGARANELGAKLELGQARLMEAGLYARDPLRWSDSLARFREAEQLYAEAGALLAVANTKRNKALLIGESGSKRETLAAMDEAAALYRRLGNRVQMAHLLLVSASYLRDFGELDASRRRLEQARLELEALEEPLDGVMFSSYFWFRAGLDLDRGDLDAAREGIRRARGGAVLPHWPPWLELLEASVLNEEDHREEARASYSKAVTLAEQSGNRFIAVAAACTVDCDGGQPAAGVACLAQRCRAEQPGFEGFQKAACQLEEARCHFRASDLARAEAAAREASTFYESRDYYEFSLRTRTILMRVAAARGDSARAVRVLRAELAKVESDKNKRLAFETALALGDVELKAGRSEGRPRLAKLEQDAKSRDFFRIARLAREALEQKAAVSVAPPRR